MNPILLTNKKWRSLQTIAEESPTFNQFNTTWTSVIGVVGTARFAKEKAVRRIVSPSLSHFYSQLLAFGGKLPKKHYALMVMLLQQDFLKLLRVAYFFGIKSSYESLGFDAQFIAMPKFRLPIEIESELKLRSLQSATFFVETSLNVIKKKKYNNIEKILSSWRGWRLKLVAEREFGYAYSKARWDVFTRSNIFRKRWVCVHDDRTREDHLRNERVGWIAINKKFPSGVMSPGIQDKDSFGCRCTLEPYFLDFYIDNLWVGG